MRGNPLLASELARLDMGDFKCVIIMCDQFWQVGREAGVIMRDQFWQVGREAGVIMCDQFWQVGREAGVDDRGLKIEEYECRNDC